MRITRLIAVFVGLMGPLLAPAQEKAVDKFVTAALKEHGLKAGDPADKVTLCRRAYFDLLGMPPTPAQVDAFVKDASANAFENLVDRLLADPHFGERMAVSWLDQV